MWTGYKLFLIVVSCPPAGWPYKCRLSNFFFRIFLFSPGFSLSFLYREKKVLEKFFLKDHWTGNTLFLWVSPEHSVWQVGRALSAWDSVLCQEGKRKKGGDRLTTQVEPPLRLSALCHRDALNLDTFRVGEKVGRSVENAAQ